MAKKQLSTLDYMRLSIEEMRKSIQEGRHDANESFTRKQYEEYFAISQKTAIRQINKLIDDELIEPIIQGKNTTYHRKTK